MSVKWLLACVIGLFVLGSLPAGAQEGLNDVSPEGYVWTPKFEDGDVKPYDYPGSAFNQGLWGLSVVDCETIDREGNVACKVVLDAPYGTPDEPKGYGFGKSTRKFVEYNYRLTYRGGKLVPVGTKRTVVQAIKYYASEVASDGKDDYRALPNAQQIRDAYPPQALAQGKSAVVLAYCTVKDADGHVTCGDMIYSTVPNMGFEAATRQLLEAHGIAARHYTHVQNSNGTESIIYPPFIIGSLRQVFIRF